ncbi:MAG: PqqD family protein [Acidobacteria bacterium]|nr:PqqD family protein [Acidobacteriota bacterium]
MRNPDARWRVPSRVVSCTVGGQTALLDTATGACYALDHVGTRFLELLGDGARLGDVAARLLGEYAVEPERLAADLQRLVEEMTARGLLEEGF